MSHTSSLCSASLMVNTSCKKISSGPQRAYGCQAYINISSLGTICSRNFYTPEEDFQSIRMHSISEKLKSFKVSSIYLECIMNYTNISFSQSVVLICVSPTFSEATGRLCHDDGALKKHNTSGFSNDRRDDLSTYSPNVFAGMERRPSFMMTLRFCK
jgi:hypothetical protein